jgi:hypothetical protein
LVPIIVFNIVILVLFASRVLCVVGEVIAIARLGRAVIFISTCPGAIKSREEG